MATPHPSPPAARPPFTNDGEAGTIPLRSSGGADDRGSGHPSRDGAGAATTKARDGMKRLRMAVVGVGHLGRHHARHLKSFPDVDLVGVVDASPQQAETIARQLGTKAYDRFEPLLGHVDAVSIVTPTSFHHHVAAEFLRRGVSALVEKPICKTVDEAEELIALARESGAALAGRPHRALQPGVRGTD